MDIDTLCSTLSKALDGGNDTYSVRAAAFFGFSLSFMLWWIPILGPAVAGYVCGRKTGSMVQGLICTLFIGAAVTITVWGLSDLILSQGGYPKVPAGEAADALTGASGLLGGYLQTFFNAGSASFNMANPGILIVFGGVGGILSSQVRREVSSILSYGSIEGAVRPAARSMELYGKNKKLGFECFNDCIAMQGMMTNKNSDMNASKEEKQAEQSKFRKPIVTTIQTVTTTVTGHTDTKSSEDGSGPFTDILQRAERRKTEK
jgi:hypothetical protein